MSATRTILLLALFGFASMGANCGSLGLTPGAGTLFDSPQTVTLEATIKSLRADEVTQVDFFNNDVLVCADPQPPYECAWSITAEDNGVNVWKATAHIANGDVIEGARHELYVRIDEEPVEPSAPVFSFLPGIGAAMDVAVDGGQAFVASNDYGLTVVDLLGQDAPQLAATAQTPFSALHTAVAEDRAVVAGSTPGSMAHLWVLDLGVSPPAIIGELGQPDIDLVQGDPSGFQDIVLDAGGNLAVAAAGTDGVLVIDLSDPSSPLVVGSYATEQTAYGLALGGDLAYVGGGSDGLLVLSLEDPRRPVRIGSLALAGAARDVSLVGDLAYVSIGGGGLKVVDVSDPTSPRLVGLSGTNILGTYVAADDRWAVVRGWDSIGPFGSGPALEVFDLSDPLWPQSVGLMPLTEITDLTVVDDRAYVPDGSEGLKVFDLGSQSTLGAIVADDLEAEVIAQADGVAVIGARHVPTGQAHLLVADTSDPSNPRRLGKLAMGFSQGDPFGFQEIEIDAVRGLAVATVGIDGLLVIDLSDRYAPTVIGSYDTPGTTYGLDLVGNLAFVADGVGDLQILDLANPESPTLIGSLSLSGVARDVSAVGDQIYVSSAGGGFAVVDVSQPSAPRQVGYRATSVLGTNVVANENWILVRGSGGDGPAMDVFAFSPSTPTRPTYNGTLPVDQVADLALEGDLAFVPDGEDGLEVWELGGEAAGHLVGVQTSVGAVYDVSVTRGLAYVADRAAALAVLSTNQ